MISIIVAMDSTGLIGSGNKLPWNVPSELQHFKKVTKDNIIIFGRKTWDSFKSPLIDRVNIVITSREKFRIYPHDIEFSLDGALKTCRNTWPDKNIFICGGRSLYQQTLPFADRIYLSMIKGQFDGDVYFPGCPNNNPRELLLSQGFTTTRYINNDLWDFYLLERFPVYNMI